MPRYTLVALTAFGLLANAGCSSHDITAPDAATQLASVIPAGGSWNVDVSAPVILEFTHAIMVGMENYMLLHESNVQGPIVAGTWTWSPERTRATFVPDSPLRSESRYVIHVGGGMMDADGQGIGFGDHGSHMGGQWASGSMMGGSGTMMGTGWRHANGTYGMVFTFTTR